MTDEMKVLDRGIELTTERADELLKELDMSTPFYYTRKKRRDPFLEMREGGGKDSKRPRRWRFWARCA